MKTKLLLLLLILSFTNLLAQKSSPVMGDAATLIDLLKKDYNMVNPDTRDEEINSDRGKVIGIFKSYLETIKKTEIENANINKDEELKNKYNEYQNQKELLNSVNKINLNFSVQSINVEKAKEVHEASIQYKLITKQLTDLTNSLKTKKNDYFIRKQEVDNLELDKLIKAYQNNPYVNYILNLFSKKYSAIQNKNIDVYAEKNAYSSIQKSIPFIGGDLAFETIIDGLSRFLAKRIKEELTLHAIDRIKKYLENPTPENYCYELLVILPTTSNYLKKFDANQLLNFTDEFKQYIEQDLNDLLTNAANLKNTPRLKKYIQNNPDLEFAFEGLEIIPQLSKIKNPIDYFEIIENSQTLNKWKNDVAIKNKYNIAQSLRFASMLAYSMTIIDNGETKFASVDFLSNYGNEINFTYLYFGFLQQQNIKYFNISFVDKHEIKKNLDIKNFMFNNFLVSPGGSQSTIISPINSNILNTNFIQIAKDAEKIYSQSLFLKKKNKNDEKVGYQEIYAFVNSILDFAQNTITVAQNLVNDNSSLFELSGDDKLNVKEKLIPYFNVAKTANNIVLDLHEKKYSNAIIKAIEIPLNFRNVNYNDFDTTKDLLNLSSQINNNRYLTCLSEVLNTEEFNKLSKNNKIKKLKSLNSTLHLLSIELYSSTALPQFKTALNNLRSSIETLKIGTSNKLEDVTTKITELKDVFTNFPTTKIELLNLVGISKLNLTEIVRKQLKQNNVYQNNETAIVNFVETYFDKITDNKLSLKKGNIKDAELNMQTVILEFAPQLLLSNSKLTDTKALKVIHFVNEMAGAKDAEEVEKAITAFALPVGSSSLKEKASHYFSVNAFPGIIAGLEYAKGQDRAFSYGFTAPVGLYGQLCNWGNGNNIGFFVPIIDIGAPVRLRIDSNNDTKTLPDFNFDDIFSPGFYVSYGFGNKLPLGINFGVQYGPKLRDIPVEGTETFESVDSFRVNLAVVIDIPLFTISGKYNN